MPSERGIFFHEIVAEGTVRTRMSGPAFALFEAEGPILSLEVADPLIAVEVVVVRITTHLEELGVVSDGVPQSCPMNQRTRRRKKYYCT